MWVEYGGGRSAARPTPPRPPVGQIGNTSHSTNVAAVLQACRSFGQAWRPVPTGLAGRASLRLQGAVAARHGRAKTREGTISEDRPSLRSAARADELRRNGSSGRRRAITVKRSALAIGLALTGIIAADDPGRSSRIQELIFLPDGRAVLGRSDTPALTLYDLDGRVLAR